MIALIDSDSIVYIVGYNHKDTPEFGADAVMASCDDFVRAILTQTRADKYLGTFSSAKNFRHDIYKYQPYKGKRGPKADFMIQWEKPIKEHLTNKWGFLTPEYMEADDVVCGLAMSGYLEEDYIICSPDKDVQQAVGLHYDYKKLSAPTLIDEQAAQMILWKQILTGDSTDDIAGVPGLGDKKVQLLFDGAFEGVDVNEFSLLELVKAQYTKYFGSYYGNIIFEETRKTVMLLQPNHPLWKDYNETLHKYMRNYVKATPPPDLGKDEDVLASLGWIEP